MNKFIPYIFLLFSFIISCENPHEQAAEVTEAQEVKKIAPEQTVNIKRYVIRPTGSELNWVGRKPAGKHFGSLGIEKGSVYVQEDSIVSGKIVIDMDDIDVVDLKSDEDSYMKLVSHLKSADFFDVETYPYATFEIISVSPLEPAEGEYLYEKENKPATELFEERKIPTHSISGNFTLKGKTLGIKFPAHLKITDQKLISFAQFSIDRTQWGVKYREEADFENKAADKLIYNDVIIKLEVLANPEQENF